MLEHHRNVKARKQGEELAFWTRNAERQGAGQLGDAQEWGLEDKAREEKRVIVLVV